MGKSAKQRVSDFARASKNRLSGRRLVGPRETKKPMVIEMVDQSGSRRPNSATEDETLTSNLNESVRSEDAPRGTDNCCVLVVGSTGTGKSSTITKLTGQDVKASSSIRRVTQKCTLYRPAYHSKSNIFEERNLFFVDTVGWEDANVDDEDTFKDILKFIDANNIINIRAVIWTVSPNVRQDALLNRQAALINKFGDKEIWNRVIISCKQSANPDTDTRGALAAALDYDPRSSIQVVGYRFLDDSSLSMDQQMSCESDAKTRETWNVKTDDESQGII